MGCAQLEQLGNFIESKRRTAGIYIETLKDIPGISPVREALWAHSVFWMSTALIDKERFGTDSRTLLKRLSDIGIQTRPLWQPLHRSPVYTKLQHRNYPVADRIYQEALSLPCSVGITNEQIEKVLKSILSVHQLVRTKRLS
jgi:perosamine synthetase